MPAVFESRTNSPSSGRGAVQNKTFDRIQILAWFSHPPYDCPSVRLPSVRLLSGSHSQFSTCLSVSVCPSVSVRLSVSSVALILNSNLSVCPSMCQSVCLSVCVCVFILSHSQFQSVCDPSVRLTITHNHCFSQLLLSVARQYLTSDVFWHCIPLSDIANKTYLNFKRDRVEFILVDIEQ